MTDNTTKAHITVATSTVIARDPKNYNRVVVLEPTDKHDGKLVLPGGRLEHHRGKSHRDCILEEWGQECGGKGATISEVKFWTVATDPNRDIRENPKITVGKLTHGRIDGEAGAIEVVGHYGSPDHLFLAMCNGEPAPKDGEAKRCFFLDLNETDPLSNLDKFGAGMGVILACYKLWKMNTDLAGQLTLLMTDFKAAESWLRAGGDKKRLAEFIGQ